MTQTEIERLQELRQKEQLTEKEFAQWEFLEKKVINDEHIEQFRKNQQEPYSSKRSRAVNLAWEFFRAVEGRCYVAVGGWTVSSCICSSGPSELMCLPYPYPVWRTGASRKCTRPWG